MDCGPACLKMVAAHYGRNYPMEYLRQEMGITRESVSLKGICVAAREIGMQTTACRMSMGSLCEDVTLPCIIHWNQNHFVVVYKIAHGKVYVADPGKGMIHYSMAEEATDRAGSRTPMQWEPGPTAGFSTCAVDSLYLPVSTDGGLLTVRAQEADPRSLLHYVRHLLRLRRDVPALGNEAGWTLLSDKMRPYPMVYRRSTAGDVCIVSVNPSAASVSASIPTLSAPVEAIARSGKVKYKRGATTDHIVMGPVSAVVYRLSRP